MKERWIVTGKYLSGDTYYEHFESIFNATFAIEKIYLDWIVVADRNEFSVDPYTLNLEYDEN